MAVSVPNGIHFKDAIKLAVDLGCEVRPINRTGETLIRHPSVERALKLNNRRKDCARCLVVLLRRLSDAREAACSPT